MNIDEFADMLQQAIIEAYKSIMAPFESLAESIADIMNDYYDDIKDTYDFDSDEAINKVSLLLMFLALHKKSRVLLKKHKRIYMRQKIP